MSIDNYLASVDYNQPTGKLRAGQIAQRSTWATVPDHDTEMAAMTQIKVAPENASTTTYVNALDWGDPNSPDWYDHDDGCDSLCPAGRR